MRIAVCVDRDEECRLLCSGIVDYFAETGERPEIDEFFSRIDLLYKMSERRFDFIFVAQNSAMGMETVIGARDIDSTVPLVWISNEKEFVPQSYRLRANLFLLKPVTRETAAKALRSCCVGGFVSPQRRAAVKAVK